MSDLVTAVMRDEWETRGGWTEADAPEVARVVRQRVAAIREGAAPLPRIKIGPEKVMSFEPVAGWYERYPGSDDQ